MGEIIVLFGAVRNPSAPTPTMEPKPKGLLEKANPHRRDF
jgi:hypothetical protein